VITCDFKVPEIYELNFPAYRNRLNKPQVLSEETGFMSDQPKETMPSTVIKSFQYDPKSQTLRIIFLSGNVYEYHNVPEKVFLKMEAYKSKGTFLNRFVKGNYEYSKIDNEQEPL